MNKKNKLKKATKSDFAWFNGDNYSFTKQFDALTWSDFIKDRLLKSWCVNGINSFVADENDELIQPKKFCDEIKNGVIKLARTYSTLGVSDGENVYGSTAFSPFWNDSHVIRNVWPLTLGDINGIEDKLDVFLNHEDNFSYIDLPISAQQWSATTGLMVSQAKGFLDIPYDFMVRRGIKRDVSPSTSQGLINLRVDLSVSNEEILDEMARLLKVYRTAISKTQCEKGYINVKKSDIEKFFPYKVLPHIDLKLWASYASLELTDALIVELLFGVDIDVKDFEAKQKKLYKKIFNYTYADSLDAYARPLSA